MKTLHVDQNDANADWTKRARDSELAIHAKLALRHRLDPYRARLGQLAAQARKRAGGRLWLRQQAEALLVPAAFSPWEWDAALAEVEREFWGEP